MALPPDLLRHLAAQHATPLWVYDAGTIRQRIAALRSFDTIRYAQKANANTHVLRLMRAEGVAVDAVSVGELERALHAGYAVDAAAPPVDAAIVYTADLLDRASLERVAALKVPVNAGSVDMLDQLGAASPGHAVWLRINPGFGHGHSQKTNTGGEHSKHGIWHADLPLALAAIRRHGLRLVGLHMHIGSGVDYDHLAQVASAMVAIAARVDLPFDAISTGGGLSVPYRAGEPAVDTEHYFDLWDTARREIAARCGHAVRLEIEPGRYLVAEAGVLLAEVRAVKDMGQRHFVLVDAGFNDLMRPAMYGSQHAIRLLALTTSPASADMQPVAPDGPTAQALAATTRPTVVAGPLCESGDVFTQGEGGTVLHCDLPAAAVGDLLVFDTAGAYGAAMSSTYNSRPLAAEVLVDDGVPRLIRRRQTVAELIGLEDVA